MSSPGDFAGSPSTISEILAALQADGFTGQMAARAGSRVICFTCREESDATEMELHHLGREEGASDPADMVAVAALICPRCGAKGTVVLGFGPESTPEDSDVLRALEDDRDETSPC